LKIGVNIKDSNIKFESRVLKSTKVQIEWNLLEKIYIIGYWEQGLLEFENIDAQRSIFRIKVPLNTISSKSIYKRNWFLRKFVVLWSIFLFNLKTFIFIIKVKPLFISIHNPFFLVVALLLKFKINCKIIYVPHELESERTGIGKIQKHSVNFVEKILKYFIHRTVLVSPEIENLYTTKMGYSKTCTIRNIPINPNFGKEIPPSNYLKSLFKIENESIVFIYQGIIGQFRGIETMVDVFFNQSRCHIVFMGYGDLVDYVKDYEMKSNYIHYHKAVNMEDIINITSSADISLFFVDEKLTKSYALTTANKFYEGIIAGTPFVISDNFIYMSRENDKHGLGWSLDSQKSSLVEFVANIEVREVLIRKKRCLQYGSQISWDFEARPFLEIYQ